MNINYDNYESYFLLYVDAELLPAEMQMVEEFAMEHPDLAIELDNLLAAKLPAATIAFDKTALLKTAVVSAAEQEQLLLLLDAELSKDSVAELNVSK
jgi:hypothetical protein